MSESIVERVARAICAAEALYDPDEIGDHGGNEANWKFHESEARAAIAAMREPTDEQRNNYYELSGKTEVFRDAAWERAIDAALK